MTSMLGDQGSDGGGLDLLAINRDAELLDLLARRAPVPAGDPVLALLAALAADVDEGLDDLLVASEDDPLVRAASAATVVPERPAPGRGHGLRVTTVAIVVGATLSIGGVAAAVTGDPLAPVKGIVTAMGGQGAEHHPGKARAFGADKQARSQLRHGDLAGAQASLAAMKAELLRDDLSQGDRRSIEARIAALQKQVDRAVASATDPQGGAGADGGDNRNGRVDDGTGTNGKATGRGGEKATGGKSTSKPEATRTTEPDAGEQGGAAPDGEKAGSTSDETSDTTSDRVRPSSVAGSGNRPRQSSPAPSDDSEDATASSTSTADPSTPSGGSAESGSHKATGGSTAGDSDAGSSKAATTDASTAQ